MQSLVGTSGRLSQHFRQAQHRPSSSIVTAVSKRDVLVGTAAVLCTTSSRPPLAQATEAPGSEQPEARQADGPPSTSAVEPKAPPKPLPPIPQVQLADGLRISKVIRGCWQLDGQHRGDAATDHTSGAAAIDDIDRFLRSGITTLDTADIYGQSEALVGQYTRLYPQRARQLRVLTKLSFMEAAGQLEQGDLSRQMLEYRVRGALARLGVPHIDLLQLHWEDLHGHGWLEAMKQLAALQQTGLVHHIGVANFDVPRLMRLLDAGIKPVSNQVAFSVIDRRPELFMTDFCRKHDIQLLPYGVLAGGFLADKFVGVPPSKARLDTISKAKYGRIIQQLGGWGWLQGILKVLKRIGKKHGVSVSNVAARWVLQQQQVPALIIGARNAAHVRDHHRLFGFTLDEVDLLDIDAAYESARQPTSDCYAWERGGQW